MAKQTDLDFIDLLGENDFDKVELSNIEGALLKCAIKYVDEIQSQMNAKDVSSSGYLQDNINTTDVEVDGQKFTVSITAPEYFSYVDEGVDGIKQSRGSRFKFKNYGVPPKMLKSLMDWLSREKKSNTKYEKYATSKRELRAKSIEGVELKKAKQVGFMIKRQGIEGKHFMKQATENMSVVIENELGQALKIDIINSFK